MRFTPPVAIGVGLSTIALYSLYAVPAAAPAAGAAATTSDASAATSAEVLHLTTLATDAGTLADAGVAVSTGTVDGDGSPRTTASAANLAGALADQVLPDLLARAQQQAPKDTSPPTACAAGTSRSRASRRWTSRPRPPWRAGPATAPAPRRVSR